MDYFFPEKMAEIIQRGKAAAKEIRPVLVSLKLKYDLTRLAKGKARSEEEKTPSIQRQKKYILERVAIRGHQKLRAPWISHSLGLTSGQLVDERVINHRVMVLYSLGYFESVQSSVFLLDENRIELDLSVKGLPREKLRVGLGFDDFRKLVMTGSAVFANLPLLGMRLESEVDPIGLTRFRTRVSFSPRALDLPFYPFLEVHYQGIPTRLYDGGGSRLASYQKNSWTSAVGWGFLFDKRFKLEFSFAIEDVGIDSVPTAPYFELSKPRTDRLKRFGLTATIDILDSVWTPKKGILFHANYEGSYEFMRTALPYERFEASLEAYSTFRERHTLCLSGLLAISSLDVPFFKHFNHGHPATFVGMNYDQLSGSQMKIFQAEYRFKCNSFFHLKAIANMALNFEQRWTNIVYSPDLSGERGLGFMLQPRPVQWV